MQRRHFLKTSLASGAFAARLGASSRPPLGQVMAEPADGEARYLALNKALDRQEIQRGWLPTTDPDYQHAPQSAIEAFKDRKFGIRIHWGLYCLTGSDASWTLAGADQRFWDRYNVLYQFFNPTDFDADAWMDMFQRSGIRYFTFTTKHHDGFSLWPTQTMQDSIRLTSKGSGRGGVEYFEKIRHNYSIMDGPYKKDIVGRMVEAGRKKGLGVGLYYSHVDWHDPAFAWDPFSLYYDPHFTRQTDPARWQTFIDHERQQVRELMTNYGPLDVVDFDIGWPREAARDIADIAKMTRKLQPQIIMRDRGIGAYGDYHTPERQIPGKPTPGLWKVIYPCGTAFSYRPNDDYHPAEWIVENLIDVTAKGGNFEVGFGPMGNGAWAPEAVERLAYAGDWLRVNGEAIYDTRPHSTYQEGSDLRFTASKDGRYVYAIALKWPGRELRLQSVKAVSGSPVTLLGVEAPLTSSQQGETLVVDIPASVAEHPPCKQAYAFKIQVRSD